MEIEKDNLLLSTWIYHDVAVRTRWEPSRRLYITTAEHKRGNAIDISPIESKNIESAVAAHAQVVIDQGAPLKDSIEAAAAKEIKHTAAKLKSLMAYNEENI